MAENNANVTLQPERIGETEIEPEIRRNVTTPERWFMGIGGGALVAYGLRRRSLGRLVLALAGAVLVRDALRGECSVYKALGINTASGGKWGSSTLAERGIHVEKRIMLNKPIHEVWQFWHDFSRWPEFIEHLHSVAPIGEKRLRFQAEGPMGGLLEWNAELIEDVENERLSWRSLPEADIANAGTVEFRPGPIGHGTELVLAWHYHPSAGVIGEAVARAMGESPEQQLSDDLRRMKALLEAGEIPTIEGQPHGTCA